MNYTTKLVTAYIVYELEAWWSNNPLNDFKLKNLLFRATNIVKNAVKEKRV